MRKLNFIYRTVPNLLLDACEKYFRVEVEGEENLPRKGPAILLPNHSGFAGLDALLLRHWIYKKRGRVPRILLHKFWFQGKVLSQPARSLGFLEANYRGGLEALEKNRLLIMFPEAEEGNFKPTNDRYRLRNFRKGFVNMAIKTEAPVIPVLIIGAEETHINLGQLKILDQLIPLPLNYFPLPAKWKIKFLPPVKFTRPDMGTERAGLADQIASGMRKQMQTALHSELSQRKYIYFNQLL